MNFRPLLLKFSLGLLLVLLAAWFMLARPFVITFSKRHSPPGKADPARLEEHTRLIVSRFHPRDCEHAENLDRAADYIGKEFQKGKGDVSTQEFTVRGRNYRNVISEFKSDSSLKTVVIGAHYDVFGEFPGADDNASGVAGILELSRLASENKLPVNLILVAYTLEEPPYFTTEMMGSAFHADSLEGSRESVKLMISLEMIGYFTDEPGSQDYPLPFLKLFYPSVGNFIAIVGPFSLSRATLDLKRSFKNSVDLSVFSINAPAFVPGVDFSDHRSYWARGIDAVMVTDTAFFRNRAYHTAEDTPDRLDYVRMGKVIDGLFSYLAS